MNTLGIAEQRGPLAELVEVQSVHLHFHLFIKKPKEETLSKALALVKSPNAKP